MSSSPSLSPISESLRPDRLIPSVTVGLVLGVVEVILAISFGALIFAGSLSQFLVPGIGVALTGAVLSGISVALLTSAPGAMSGNQDIASAIIAVAAASIAVNVPAGTAAGAMFATVVWSEQS